MVLWNPICGGAHSHLWVETDQIKFFVEECAGEEVDRIQEIEFSGVVEHAAVEEKLAGFFHGISPYGTESDQREKVHCIIGTVYWRYSTGWN